MGDFPLPPVGRRGWLEVAGIGAHLRVVDDVDPTIVLPREPVHVLAQQRRFRPVAR